MQTHLFPMPPTPKARLLFMDNRRNRVFTPILSAHYPARLQDHQWTLGDREPSVMYKQFYGYIPFKVPLTNKKRRKRNGNEKVATVTSNRVYIRIWSSLYILFITYCLSLSEPQRPRKTSPPVTHATSHVQPPKTQSHKVFSFLFFFSLSLLTRRNL
jgi:hypothetical protein